MKIRYFIITVILVILSFFMGYYSKSLNRAELPDVYPNSFSIHSELRVLEIPALLGSVKYSAEMTSKFEDCRPRKAASMGLDGHTCHLESLFWEQIDAENGGTYGASAITNRLIRSNRCSDALRARFWAIKLAKLGAGSSYFDTANERIRQVCKQKLATG